jgi:glycosyltransferase involved in cell wall biosynthesis
MTITGLTIIRNGLKYDYPFIESIKSLIPICDEIIVVAGNSDDGTNEAIAALNEPKIKMIHTVWDESLRTGGIQLADQNSEIDGLLFPYFHFYGAYNYIKISRSAYRYEIRIFKNNRGILSYKDAQGFRKYINKADHDKDEKLGSKLSVIYVDTPIFHYGYVKPPEVMQTKVFNFSKLWHSDEEVVKRVGEQIDFDYSNYEGLQLFSESHPKLMQDRVSQQSWLFQYDPNKAKMKFKHRVLLFFERITGYRLFEYKNYKLRRID